VDLDTARPPRPPGAGPEVTALYQAHGVGLIRLAVVMLGDRPAAEDVVQEAFCGLYRRWDHLADPQNALRYVRSSVLNGCRSVLRNRGRLRLRYRRGAITGWPNVLWSNSSGSTLIVKTTRPDTGPSQHGDLTPEVVGVVTRGHFTPLPGISAGNMLAW